jgi:superfamily II DNA or RNA helicase
MEDNDIRDVKNELNVRPNAPPISPVLPPSFPIYRETKKHLIVPRFYGFHEFGQPDSSSISYGQSASKQRLTFKGQMRNDQKKIINTYLDYVRNKNNHGNQQGGGGLISVGCGQGKCFARNTPIMLYDGRTLPVQLIRTGDKLMGDDGSPRNVLSTTRGIEEMVKVTQKHGISYTVNMSHILSLYSTKNRVKLDISAREYILYIETLLEEGSDSFKQELQGYKAVLEFPHQPLKHSLEWYAQNLIKHPEQFDSIPKELKMNTRKIRIEFLSILLDTFKHSYHHLQPRIQDIICHFQNSTITKHIADDIMFIAFSAGVHLNSTRDIMPVDQILTSFEIQILPPDIYYGFEIDGNRRFVLSDGTVTHNTVMALNIISQLQRKTLVVVHKEFLMNQWIERIRQFLPSARIGRIQGKIIDTQNKDIVLGMLQSLSMKEYSSSLYNEFGFTVIDECFPAYTQILSTSGAIPISELFNKWNESYSLPKVMSYNRENRNYEWKSISYAWKCQKYEMITVHYKLFNRKWHSNCFTCTANHKILVKTPNGTKYIRACNLKLNHKLLLSYSFNTSVQQNAFVTHIVSFKRIQDVYDIEVSQNHNFVIIPQRTQLRTPTHGIVVSNCHHIGAEVFSRALFNMVTPYMLGLSATLQRKDGLSKVFKYFIGNVIYEQKQKQDQHNVLVRAIQFQTDNEIFNRVEYNFKGQINYAIMIRKLCESTRRSEFILNVVYDLLQENNHHQIMVLAHNKSVLKYFHDSIQHREWATVGYYVGGMKEKDLKNTEKCRVVIATYAMAEEALDIKTLTTLVMATPKTDVQQAVGRILRSKHSSARPIVVDITDTHDVFKRQWKKREKYYRKRGYSIICTTSTFYNSKREQAYKNKEFKGPPFENHPNRSIAKQWISAQPSVQKKMKLKNSREPRELMGVNIDNLNGFNSNETQSISNGFGQCVLNVTTEELDISLNAYCMP